MADDVFRGRAVIVDQMSPGLRAIREEFARLNRGISTSAAGSRRDVNAMRDSFRMIGTEIRGFTLPALSAMGLAGGGLAASVIGISRSVKGYAEKIQDLGNSSRELGLSARNIRAFELAASNVRINPGQAMQGLETFKKNAEDFQLRIGGLRDELRKLGAGDVVEAIAKARDPLDQMRIAFERMEELQKRNPAVAKRFAESMFGSAQFARMGWDELAKAMGKVGDLTKEEFERAERLNKKWNEIGKSFETLKDKILGGPLSDNMQSALGAANKGADALGQFLGKIPDSPGWGSKVEPLDPKAPSQPSNGELRLPRMIDPRRKEDTKEGTEQGVESGMEKFFQKHSSNTTGNAGGFMNAALGGTTGSLPSGGMGRWGGGGYELKGLGGGASNGQSIPAPSPGGGSRATVGGSTLDLTGSAKVGGEFMKGRERFAAELAANPALKEKLFGIVMGENKDDKAGRSVMESAMNRAVVRGTSLAQELRTTAEGGYYAGFRPGDVNRYRQRLESQLKDTLAGSNISDYATDNASQGLAARHRAKGTFPFRREYGKESFFGPDVRIGKHTKRWKALVAASEAEQRNTIGGQPVTPDDEAGVVGNARGRTFNDQWNDRIDGALGGRNMSGPTGTVNLNVTAPSGTKVEGKADGMFKEMSVKRYRQMNETGLGGGE